MRNPLLLLLLCARLVNAGCDCEQIEQELERETIADASYHGCRNCREVMISASACPAIGYECSIDYRLTTNVLFATGACQCREARCAGSAKLAHAGSIVNKIRCNNSEWTVKGKPVDSVVCAKECTRTCMRGNSEAPNDFSPLKVAPATGRSDAKCGSMGTCANGLVAINTDGTPIAQLDDVSSVACSVDGVWTYSLSGAAHQEQFVMCNASPCGPARCPAQTPNTPAGGEVPLIVTGKGEACAEATCSTGYVKMAADGSKLQGITTTKLACTKEGEWKADGGQTYAWVMCEQPPCPYNCDAKPIETPIMDGGLFTAPSRKGCAFFCPSGMGLFRRQSNAWAYAIRTATCQSDERYHSDSFSEARIGCYKCDVSDGEYQYSDPNFVKPSIDHCVMSCPADYRLNFQTKQVDRLYRKIAGLGPSFGIWIDPGLGDITPGTIMRCLPK